MVLLIQAKVQTMMIQMMPTTTLVKLKYTSIFSTLNRIAVTIN